MQESKGKIIYIITNVAEIQGELVSRGRKPYSNIVVTIIFAILYTLFVDDKGGEKCY